LKRVGLSCCPQDAAYEVLEMCKYISHIDGGKGAARDVISQVMRVQGTWDKDFDAKYD
jgi:3-deoxy-D-manno-octulosonate 8-phosphate phosphatase (KDO 8-P phosphatase)